MNLSGAVETYLSELGRVRASGGATGERSFYGPLANLLNAIGSAIRPKVACVGELADQGAGHPDFGLYAARQLQKNQPKQGQIPERGVVEVKAAADDAWLTAASQQVSRYWSRYRLVLITNTRDFVLLGENAAGGPATLETFRLADNAATFTRLLETPRASAGKLGPGLGEYLARALSHRARLADPKDLAWLLASYARDALARVEAAGDAPQLATIRAALEEALGVHFEGERGGRFFRSTLVQTLFYGVFSAWVLWARQRPASAFDWRLAVWHLRAPVLRALFQQLSDPGRLRPLGLVEVLDWTAAALDRVDRAAFFTRFSEGDAVPYFYEPFLQAFDPALRKQLGVWYTPAEVVRYMVARVDGALKHDLGIADGLASDKVYVLDPCCGTGAYLAETLRRIAANLAGKGLGALTGAAVKRAATERVFGFEIMPAPFVVAHLQVGLTMQELDAPLADDSAERPGVFLTNALTGWEPRTTKPLPFPELEDERDRAEQVKCDTPILVILGNPPYNGFAGMAIDEERELSDAYRTTMRVRRPEGQGLNDLYVRFFRMAERRIAKTGQGVVCFISNYSWLDGLSFTPAAVSPEWSAWPALPELLPVSFPGVKTSRDGFLVDIDLDRLKARLCDYFNRALGHEEIDRRYPVAMKTTGRFDARAVRDALLARGGPNEAGFIRYAYRPFDNRWLYWEEDSGLFDRPRPEYRPHVFDGNLWLVLQNKARPDLSPPLVISDIGDLNQMNSGVYCVPICLRRMISKTAARVHTSVPNLSPDAQSYLKVLNASPEDLFHHILAVLHDSTYNQINADALRTEGPRIPLPGWPDGGNDAAAEALARSAARGRELAGLLDPDTRVSGVTQGDLRPDLAVIAVPATADGRNMTGDDFALTAGWGHFGTGDAVMPGQGRAVEREYTTPEITALGDHGPALGASTFDIYLNARAFWRNVPAAVWRYKLGGYPVLKKWLSYRERKVLGRPLLPEEVQHFTDTARCIAALLRATSSH